MTAGQQVIADYYRMFPRREPAPTRVITRDDSVTFYVTDGDGVIYGRSQWRTEERYI
ncbi:MULTISPECIES: hypothetical protein [unclassified Bradyrhizobium]|uniref:hypothetical protein n=1 Tax=unclassified Bradyrhizobium TaxID=2631580 RepID=UPI001FFAE1CD|nr:MULTISPECIES: hypothetical protein [unclassified Bradyrhizobium]MCK1526187.1 hypothetical protein [Bradyrhizobium sp. 17]MCK1691722.1 hypothetical protein [Bradyrhizobium sp. 145]